MRLEDKTWLKVVLIATIALTVCFIFVQSMLSPETSSEESDAVGEFVGGIIPPETKPGEFIQINIRKIAHFSEFALLGLEISLYALFFHRKKSFILMSYAFALFIALIDETIQLFSGRGPSIFDVWLDFFGFATLAMIVYAVAFAVRFFRGERVERWLK